MFKSRILRWEESRQRECGPESSVILKQGARLWALRRVGHEGHSAEAGLQLEKARRGLPRASEEVWLSQQLDLSPVKLVLDF